MCDSPTTDSSPPAPVPGRAVRAPCPWLGSPTSRLPPGTHGPRLGAIGPSPTRPVRDGGTERPGKVWSAARGPGHTGGAAHGAQRGSCDGQHHVCVWGMFPLGFAIKTLDFQKTKSISRPH